jgi:carbonic anhydrase
MTVDQTVCETSSSSGRRRFMRIALLGGGAMLAGAGLPAVRANAAETDALLLSCMDFRLIDETERYMAGRGLRKKYDHIILAGASLGALTEKYPAWGKTFWEHLEVAIQLHKIHKVFVMDHRDCGAYKVILVEDLTKDPAKEKAVHASKLTQLAKLIKDKYPKLEVELLLMSLDGKVEVIV